MKKLLLTVVISGVMIAGGGGVFAAPSTFDGCPPPEDVAKAMSQHKGQMSFVFEWQEGHYKVHHNNVPPKTLERSRVNTQPFDGISATCLYDGQVEVILRYENCKSKY